MKMRKTHLALLIVLLLGDPTLQSGYLANKTKRQSGHCPAGWEKYERVQSCYLFGRLKVTWFEAVAICYGIGSKLLEPKSENEMIMITYSMRSKRTGGVWIGGNKILMRGLWRWFEGNIPIGPYTAWHEPLNPSNTGGKNHC